MEVTWAVLLVLLPGVLAMKLRDAITGTGKREFKESLLSAAMYVMVVYGLLGLLSLVEALKLTPLPWVDDFNPWTIAAVAAIALFVGAVIGIADEFRVLQKLALKLGLSHRGWRNAWADAFDDARGSWVNVCLADGREIDGWAKFYSSDGKAPLIYIKEATILSADKRNAATVEGPGVLVTPNAGVTLVQFLAPVDQKIRPDLPQA